MGGRETLSVRSKGRAIGKGERRGWEEIERYEREVG